MNQLRVSSSRLGCALLAAVGVASAASAADLCQGLVQDKAPHPMTSLAKPAVGQAVRDPQFGATIRRITAVTPTTAADAAIVPVYSTVSAWNADESLLLLYHVGRGHELYDGRTYRFLRQLDITPNDIEQVYWHTGDPDVLLYPSGTSLIRYHVGSRAKEIVQTFACSGPVNAGDAHMFTSWDSNTIGLQCGTTGFIYQIATNTVTGATSIASGLGPMAAAGGTRAFLGGAVLDLGLRLQRRLDVANAYEHSSLGRLANGHDTFNSVAFDPGPLGSGVGSLVTYDLADGSSRVVVGPATGFPYPPSMTHVSALAYRAPGWVFLSIVGNPSGTGVLDNEIVVADTNTGRVCRAAHHRSFGRNNTWLGKTYWAEPHVVASPSGTRAVFASDWGNGSTVDTYVVELPADLGLTLSVSTDKDRYATGDTLRASLSAVNAGHTGVVDFLLFLVVPDGDQAVMLTPQGARLGRLSRPSSLIPAWAGVDLTAPWQTSDTFFTYTWTGTQSPGTYAWVLAAVRPGSLADDRWDPGDVLASSVAVFTFSR